MKIIIITGNNLNEESGMTDFSYYENIKDKDYINYVENYINNEYKYKYPNFSHQKIIDFVNKISNIHNIKIYDQSYFNLLEKIPSDIEIIKLEKDISNKKCLLCNKIKKEDICNKCKTKTIHSFPMLNDTFPNYEKLLIDIGMKKLMNLNFKFEENGENQPIWTFDTNKNEEIIIISIGLQDTVLEMEIYFQDIIKLNKKKNIKIYYLDNKISQLKIDYNYKLENILISEVIEDFLEEILKTNKLLN
jgi:hypothetical protein